MKFNKIITTIMLVVSLMILFGVLIACTDAEASNNKSLEFDDDSTFDLISSDTIDTAGYTFKLYVIQDKDTKVQYAVTVSYSSSGSVIMTPLYNKDGSLKTFLN